jgi:cell fate (sporulation/competence/biofilm development) regulator YmcA (YheA/YmcA/DUF963 family)
VSKNDEDVLKLSEDFVNVKGAEWVAVDTLSQQIKELNNGIILVKEMAKKYALSSTDMGEFSLSAESKMTVLTNEFAKAKVNFADLIKYFGEDPNLTPEALFRTINTFVSMFDQAYKEMKDKGRG